MKVHERFLKYVMFDTMSDESSESRPSTQGQRVFAQALCRELEEMGISDIRLDQNGIVYGRIPSNCNEGPTADTKNNAPKEIPVIGFIAHMDTVSAFPGPSKEHPPRLIENYDGGIIKLNEEISLDPEKDDRLKQSIGRDIIVTDGSTLLGADDKAGVAEIMTALEYIIKHPEFSHGDVAFSFTIDEEIGTGIECFDIDALGADFAYTVDGTAFGEIEYENFNGCSAEIEIKGFSTHPGEGKDKLINSLLLGMELADMLPAWKRPEHAQGREGFYHLTEMTGNCDICQMRYIIREADKEIFKDMKDQLIRTAEYIERKYKGSQINVKIKESYSNMLEKIKPHMHLIKNAGEAIEELGTTPISGLIRGATDGAVLSYKGLPCPNLGTGSFNHHSVREFADVSQMEKSVELILKIIGKYAK